MKRFVFIACLLACGCQGNPMDTRSGSGGSGAGSETASGSGSGSGSGSETGSGGGGGGCPVDPSTDALVVATDKGLVKGKAAGAGFAFLGIPFAAPPVGALRFEPPVAAACWSGVADATKYGDSCAQWNAGKVTGSEDCLSLNVWTPALPAPSSQARPVLVWMYGGGDFAGTSDKTSSGTNEYDGQALANAEGAVVVSFNYRLGPLGFLAHPALTASNPEHTSGNYGLLDALRALQWVQDNIDSFGGDKARVTIFGQSAGAIDICSLVSSPLSHGLFSGALMESGNCAAEPLSYRYDLGTKVADEVSCSGAADVAACLKDVPLSRMVQFGGVDFLGSIVSTHAVNVDPKHFADLPFGPTIDGYVLDDAPLATIQDGAHNHVALVVGTNADELAFLVPPGIVSSCLEYETIVHAMFPSLASQLLGAYPCDKHDKKSGEHQLIAALSDAFFVCPSRRMLRAAAATQTEPVYRYLFSHAYSSGPRAALGAAHADEIPYVFDTFAWLPYVPTPSESALSRQIQGYWGNFAASANPNGAGLPTWSAYDPTHDNALQLDTPIGNTSAIEASGCDLWDTVQ